jgi:hypothetical protein
LTITPLILGIAAAAGWIIFDAAVSIVTYPLMPTAWWITLVLSGAVLVILTATAQILEYRSHQRDTKQQSQEHAAIATATMAIFERLAAITQTTGQPIANVIEVATSQIARLEGKVERYESIVWIPPSYKEKQKIAVALQNLGRHSVQILHTGQSDCYEFAVELAETFNRARWSVLPVNAQASVHGIRSIETMGKLNDIPLIRQVSDVLLPLTLQGMSRASPDYAGHADITISIGPRKMRSGDFL